MPTTHRLFWWNLENLFDTVNSTNRTEKLQRTLNKELKGWTTAILSKKIAQLNKVITALNPDILGVCEVENLPVLQQLVDAMSTALNRPYKVLHQDTKDARGIDVAFIYDSSKYTPKGELFSLEVMRRNATRDIVQVQLQTKAGNLLVLLGNHWPARSDGKYESEPFRMMVGEVLSYWVKRIHEIEGKGASIVAMGDFNDEPFDRSLVEYAKSTHIIKQIENSTTTDYLYNLSAACINGKLGTYVFGNEINVLDQFLVSKAIAVKTKLSKFSVAAPVRICHDVVPGMVKGEYNAPVKFGRPAEASTFNKEGFSDHLPIALTLEEK